MSWRGGLDGADETGCGPLRLAGLVCLSVYRHPVRHRVLPRTRPLSRGALVRREDRRLFPRVRPRTVRPGRLRTARAGAWRRIPLGGYVKFHGDANAASVDTGSVGPSVDRSRTLAAQPLPSRAAIVLAGPVANFILAFVIFTGMFMAFGRVEHLPRIGRVEANSPAAAAGFQTGDLVKSIDGDPIQQFRGAAGIDADEHRPADELRRRSQRTRRLADGDAQGHRRRPGRVRQAPHGPSRARVFG